MNVKKGDYVLVITGSDKGKTGEVSNVYPKTGRIKVLVCDLKKFLNQISCEKYSSKIIIVKIS
jgi:ribosomal protein L24